VLEAVFTTALDPSLLAGELAGWLAALVLLLVVFELLPQPASAAAAASTGTRNFKDVGTVWLLPRERMLALGSST